MVCSVLLACLFFGAVFMLFLHWTDSFSYSHEPKDGKPTALFDRVMNWWRWTLCAFGGLLLVAPFMCCALLKSPWPLFGILLFPSIWSLRSFGDLLIKQWFLQNDLKLLELACHKLKEPNKRKWHSFEVAEVIKALERLGLGDEIRERYYKASRSFHSFDESAVKKRMSRWCRTGA